MVIKRDGQRNMFNPYKIELALAKAGAKEETQKAVSEVVTRKCLPIDVSVEEIQEMVITELMKYEPDVAQKYILYREHRNRMRGRKQYDLFTDIIDVKGSNLARDNANMNAYTPSGMMYKFAAITSQQYAKDYLLSDSTKKAISDNILHVHDLDYYPTKAVNCLQHPLDRILGDGFRANHAANRPAKRIESAATMEAISLQTIQNEMFGGQAIPAHDFYLAPYVRKTYEEECEKLGITPQKVNDYYARSSSDSQTRAKKATVRRVHQAMEGFIHNMNDMHSRGGNQVVFSSINYGTDTSPEGRCIMKELLLATEEGVGNGETALFPIQIFKVKKGVNLYPDDPNYDLFQLACQVTTKRFFPNFINLDATFNQHPAWKKDDPDRYLYEPSTMGCRTRVFEDRHGMKTSVGRGNLSFNTLNLPRLALMSGGDLDKFWELLDHYIDVAGEALYDRFRYQCSAFKFQFPLLMSGMWKGSDKLDSNKRVRDVLKHGTLAIGFIGLAEALIVLTGKHHGESEESQQLGLKIVGKINDKAKEFAEKYDLNYSAFATPAEGLSGKFVPKDREDFGVIEHVTDKDYYTNSNHVPVWYKCSIYHKLQVEAPYHELTKGGHIVYAEFDGDAAKNPDAVEAFVRQMVAENAGYGSINHTRGRCLSCGFETADKTYDKCPICGGHMDFIQRITGYLVGSTDRWNDGKRAELEDRVSHTGNHMRTLGDKHLEGVKHYGNE